MLNILKKWWFYLIILIIFLLIYYILSYKLGVLPSYQCGSTMGPEGVVNWCQWVKSRGLVLG
jgi:hypothetical protein